ncbi:MAG TPA: hypothetical protein PLP08_17070 [Plasticicumulans sp.]|uniref:hypothetical protein n=1 Tax=Plasticicumulans sp. TaxID=2307179 RepID=UPI002C00A279|nr:hypothetical protein [Plasticicumulans sp.]HNE00939.1 hypothetical protein [Plasticicumulans sp.]HNG51304.1 hypothetical protein [Plasticicumulans sp.]HNI24123.1 hypothetical protein [Plasticicumulans sp.]HNJ08747.1 hypothetical protein [Plasticicumulans sp.]HNM44372.1 hypothetical protein [Plasticicumulans sp.]
MEDLKTLKHTGRTPSLDPPVLQRLRELHAALARLPGGRDVHDALDPLLRGLSPDQRERMRGRITGRIFSRRSSSSRGL